MSIHTVTVTFDINTDDPDTCSFLDDVIVTALEGGIGYWSKALEYRPSQGFAVIVVEDDLVAGGSAAFIDGVIDGVIGDKGARTFKIDRDAVARGIATITAATGPFYDPNGAGTQCQSVPFLSASTRLMVGEAAWQRDASDIDADVADSIIQVALFGKIVYG
jgi:hypothetical protein